MNKKVTILLTFIVGLTANLVLAEGTQGMPGLPRIQPKKSYSVRTNDEGEELVEQRGFGDKEPEIKMMNLMMVEGSGYEGMDMKGPAASGHMMTVAENPPTKDTGKSTGGDEYVYESKIAPDPSKVGANILTIHLMKAGKPAKGLKLKAQVYMTSMDMGTEEPKMKEVKPGEYQVKAIFSMAGPWAVKLISPEGEKIFEFNAVK